MMMLSKATFILSHARDANKRSIHAKSVTVTICGSMHMRTAKQRSGVTKKESQGAHELDGHRTGEDGTPNGRPDEIEG